VRFLALPFLKVGCDDCSISISFPQAREGVSPFPLLLPPAYSFCERYDGFLKSLIFSVVSSGPYSTLFSFFFFLALLYGCLVAHLRLGLMRSPYPLVLRLTQAATSFFYARPSFITLPVSPHLRILLEPYRFFRRLPFYFAPLTPVFFLPRCVVSISRAVGVRPAGLELVISQTAFAGLF